MLSKTGDFSLVKYFESYLKVKKSFVEKEGPIFGDGKFENAEFIIYTNAIPNFDTKKARKEELAEEDILIIEGIEKSYYKLGEYKDDLYRVKLKVEIEEFLPKKKEKTEVDKLKPEIEQLLSELIKTKEDEREKIKKFLSKEGIDDDKIEEFLNRLNANEVKTTIKDFLSILKIFAGQPNESDLAEAIKKKMLSTYPEVGDSNKDAVFDNIKSKVERWWKEGNKFLTKKDKSFEESVEDIASEHGIEYAKRLGIALLIQGAELGNKYHQFSLKRQEPNAGKFGDVVLHYAKDGRKKWKLIQAKHNLKAEEIALEELASQRGSFSLKEYFSSYRSTIKKNEFLKNSDVECVVYTNRFFSEKERGLLSEQKAQDPILDIKASNPKDPSSSKRYKFNAEKIEDIKKKIPSLSDVNPKELEGFLENLVFAINQPNDIELIKITRAKIKEKFNDEQSVIDINSRLYEEIGKWEAKDKKDKREFISGDWIEKFFKDTKERILGGITFEVRNPVETFTGRVKELDDLHKKMTKTGGFERTALISPQLDDSKNPASVTGLGGVGKTELARKYAEIHRGDYTDQIWIDASTFGIEGSLRDLAKKLWINEKDINGKNKGIQTIAEDIYKFFLNNPQRKPLFIFDNAEGYKDIKKFLPGPSNNKPYVLITSRSKNWDTEEDGKIEQLELKVFSEDEAKEFIIKSLGKNNLLEEDIKALAKELGYLPLALKQATAYIKRNEGLSIKEYLNEYKIEVEKTKKLLNSKKLMKSQIVTQKQCLQLGKLHSKE